MPMNASALALLFCGAWFLYFYGANLTAPIFGPFCFDSSELPIITVYALYIPIFIMFIKKEGKNSIFKNVVMPILAIVCSLFMIFVAIYAHGITKYQAAAANGEFSFPVLFYLIVFAVIMAIGALLYKPRKKE
jgi:APA family basic amino acid/polyamine antiporter